MGRVFIETHHQKETAKTITAGERILPSVDYVTGEDTKTEAYSLDGWES